MSRQHVSTHKISYHLPPLVEKLINNKQTNREKVFRCEHSDRPVCNLIDTCTQTVQIKCTHIVIMLLFCTRHDLFYLFIFSGTTSTLNFDYFICFIEERSHTAWRHSASIKHGCPLIAIDLSRIIYIHALLPWHSPDPLHSHRRPCRSNVPL